MFETIKGLFFSEAEDEDPIVSLRQLFDERESTLQLTAQYNTPRPNMTDQPTVVFPYTVYTESGDVYTDGRKEFRLPDNGLEDETSSLVQFLKAKYEIGADEVQFAHLEQMEGKEADAYLNSFGNIEVA
jgi:hypothetical protein